MKYIDADKFRAGIESSCLVQQISADYNDGREDMKNMVLDLIDSLQQEQQEKKEVKFVFPKFLYARTTNNKTIDVSYAPQSLDAVEYIKNDPTEQPEVDLENYLENYFKGWRVEEEIGLTKPDGWSCILDDLKGIARHFYQLGFNARKEE